MTLWRIIIIIGGALLLMLCVVTLRTETTRLHYVISQHEQRVTELRQKLRQAELELAQLKNPLLLRQKVEQALRDLEAAHDSPDADTLPSE